MYDYNETTTTTRTTSSSSSTTNGRNTANLGQLLMIFQESIGRRASGYEGMCIRNLLTDDVDPRIITYALHQAAMAPYPSWRYAQAIIRRCVQEAENPRLLEARDVFAQYGGPTGPIRADDCLPY